MPKFVGPRLISLVLLAPGAVLAIGFVKQPVTGALTFAALVIDSMLIVVVLVGALALPLVLVSKPAVAAHASVAASCSVIVLTSTLLLTGALRSTRDSPVMFLCVFALCTALLNMSLRGVHFSTHLPRKVWIGLGAIGVVPLLQFAQGLAYLPLQTQVSLNQSLGARSTSKDGKNLRGVVEVDVENTSDTRAFIFISDLKICHWSVPADAGYDEESLRGPNCRSETPLGERTWIDGHSHLRFSLATSTPADRPLIQLVGRVAYARGDVLREVVGSETPRTGAALEGCSSVRSVLLQEESRFKSLAQQSKFLMYAVSDDSGGLRPFIVPENRLSCRSRDRLLSDYYGVTEQKVVWQGWFVPSVSSTR
jgi:hypothetical protein